MSSFFKIPLLVVLEFGEFPSNSFERAPSVPEGDNREFLAVIDAHAGLGTRTMSLPSPARPSFNTSPTFVGPAGGIFLFIF